ncbi:MAG: nucleotide exchange factor GrpE [Nitrosopumilaceae archaeon]|jgi:molecular chaperone GrpE
MSNEDDSIPVNVISENETKSEDKESDNEEVSLEFLKNSLNEEKQKSQDLENKLKHAIADYQNLSKKTQSDIENGINNNISQIMLEFLNIYDDFKRAKEAFSKNDENTKGLDSIIKNMDSLLAKYNVAPIDALGEIFDPNLHEAISIVNDPKLDDNTVVKEIRKGYISQNRVIRPSLVEISKKQGEIKND